MVRMLTGVCMFVLLSWGRYINIAIAPKSIWEELKLPMLNSYFLMLFYMDMTFFKGNLMLKVSGINF